MALKFEIDSEAFESLDDGVKSLYEQHGDVYRLQVEGIDPADELKEALRKEREERAAEKKRRQEIETESERKERERLEAQQEWQELSKKDKEKADKLERELGELRDKVANSSRMTEAESAVAGLIDKTAQGGEQRYKMLRKEALDLITYTPEGVKINGPDGDAWDAKQLRSYLTENYPFLVDGSKASGGGASGGKGGGASKKKFNEMTGGELKALRESDPAEYDRLKSERNH